MKCLILPALAAIATCSTLLAQDKKEDDMQKYLIQSDTKTSPETEVPQFRVDTAQRGSGSRYSFSLYGGANLSQTDNSFIDLSPTLGPASDLEFSHDTDSNISYHGGLRLGYSFDPFASEMNEFSSEDNWIVVPEIFLDLFYVNWDAKGNVNQNFVGLSDMVADTNFDVFAFTVNGIAKFKYKGFAPYLGGGFGGAAMFARPSTLTFNNLGTDFRFRSFEDDFVFAMQAIAGIELELIRNFAIFTEYKFLYLHSASFKHGEFDLDMDFAGTHLVSGGLKLYF